MTKRVRGSTIAVVALGAMWVYRIGGCDIAMQSTAPMTFGLVPIIISLD